MPDYDIEVSDDVEARAQEQAEQEGFENVEEFIAHTVDTYVHNEKNRQYLPRSGMALSLNGRHVDCDKKTLNRMKAALHIDD